jgi:hypothetical protein
MAGGGSGECLASPSRPECQIPGRRVTVEYRLGGAAAAPGAVDVALGGRMGKQEDQKNRGHALIIGMMVERV